MKLSYYLTFPAQLFLLCRICNYLPLRFFYTVNSLYSSLIQSWSSLSDVSIPSQNIQTYKVIYQHLLVEVAYEDSDQFWAGLLTQRTYSFFIRIQGVSLPRTCIKSLVSWISCHLLSSFWFSISSSNFLGKDSWEVNLKICVYLNMARF